MGMGGGACAARRLAVGALLLAIAAATGSVGAEELATDGDTHDTAAEFTCPPGYMCIPFQGDGELVPPDFEACAVECATSGGDGGDGRHDERNGHDGGDDDHRGDGGGGASTSDYVISLILLAHSGMFSGLTLGLMSLDLAGLRIVISGGTEEEAQYALKILPLRKRGNLLLCTLLIGNTLVNAAFAIFSASFTGGVAGTLISTSFIVVIGEITPQSICARHGLRIGAATIPIVQFYMIVLFPVAWPIALALDRLLGDEMGTVYNKKELEMLMQMHVDDEETPLTARDQEIFRGMLQLSDHCVKDIMTKLEDCYMIEVNSLLTFDKMLDIYRRGYTRIPVYKGTKDFVVGLLYTKDLIMVDPEDDLPVERVLEFCNRELLSVDAQTNLDLMFQQVESGRSHLYFVQNKVSEVDEATKHVAGVIGIVTLEDVIEELIQKEIVDESDQVRDNISKARVQVGEASQVRRIEFFRAMQSADRRVDQRELTLTDGETTAVTSFLATNVKHMTKYQDGSHVPEEMLYAFVKRCKVENFDADSIPTAPPLYVRNTASDRCCIILTGHVKIIAGEEGFESECGAWTILGLSATQLAVYMPDFTAKVKGPDAARIMYITNSEFRNFIQGKRVPRRSFDQSFGADSNPGPVSGRRRRRDGRGRQSGSGAVKSPRSSQAGRTSPASTSQSEEDEQEEVGAAHSNVARLETVAASPQLTPALAPNVSLDLKTIHDNDDDGTSGSPGRSPPMMALPSPRPSEPAIFRLHSVEKNPYKEQSPAGAVTTDDSASSNAPGSGQRSSASSPTGGERGGA